MKERHPRGVSDDPRPRMEKACERLSEPPEPERARAFWCLPPAPLPRTSLRGARAHGKHLLVILKIALQLFVGNNDVFNRRFNDG